MLRKSLVREGWHANFPALGMIIESVEEVRDMGELAFLGNSYRTDPMRLELEGQAVVQRTRWEEGPIGPDDIAQFDQREHRLFLGQGPGCLHCSIGPMAGEQDRLPGGNGSTTRT